MRHFFLLWSNVRSSESERGGEEEGNRWKRLIIDMKKDINIYNYYIFERLTYQYHCLRWNNPPDLRRYDHDQNLNVSDNRPHDMQRPFCLDKLLYAHIYRRM